MEAGSESRLDYASVISRRQRAKPDTEHRVPWNSGGNPRDWKTVRGLKPEESSRGLCQLSARRDYRVKAAFT